MPIRTRRKSGPRCWSIERRPLWPGRAAAVLHLDLERREVELVVEHGQRVGAQLVEAQRLADRAAAVVHEGRGLEQQHLFAADPAFLQPARGTSSAPGRSHALSAMRVDRHEADVVPVQRILRTRIAEADPDLHRTPSPLRGSGHWGEGAGIAQRPGLRASPSPLPASGSGLQFSFAAAQSAFVGIAFFAAQRRRSDDRGDGEVAIGDRADRRPRAA